MRQVLSKLNANVRLKWEKRKFAQSEIELLGYKLTQTGIQPINTKVQVITEKMKPKNLKDLRSYLGAVNQINRFIRSLVQLCHPLQPLLRKDQQWKWEETHDKAFNEINKQVQKITEVGHFKRSSPITITCDASKAGLGAVLELETKLDGGQFTSPREF